MYRSTIFVIALSTLTVACADDDADPSGPTEDVELFPQCEETDFASAAPFFGPGYDPDTGLMPPMQDEYVVSTTVIKFKRDALPRFLQLSADVTEQAMTSDGFVGYQLGLSQTCDTARTVTVWRSVPDMYGFVNTGAHATAMAATEEVAVTGAVTYFDVPASEIPIDWEMARDKIAKIPVLER